MPPLIEIKGLASSVKDVQAGLRDVRQLAGEVSAEAGMLKVELDDVKTQIKQARDDIRFEAQTLGNSGAASAAQLGEHSQSTPQAAAADGAGGAPQPSPLPQS